MVYESLFSKGAKSMLLSRPAITEVRLTASFIFAIGIVCLEIVFGGVGIMGQQPAVLTNSAGIQMIHVPRGSFINIRGAKITLTYDFYIGTTEVTQGQYKAIMGKNPSPIPAGRSEEEYVNHPVVNVSHRDARKFCWELTHLPEEKKARKRYRLPRESEWECACRAGTTTKYYWGDDPSMYGEFAWYKENAGGTTQPVAMKKPNAWGMYDCFGNVWEMMEDYDGVYLEDDATDPRGPFYDDLRVIRGGSFMTTITKPAIDERFGYAPTSRYAGTGFRIVAVIDNSEPE
jgi:formylglycine-generating enzyme required for sulfatase activity